MYKKLIASPGKVWAYRDQNNEELYLGSVLYLGKNDDISRYYEVDDPNYVPDKNNDIIVDNSTENIVE